jgi:membrane protein involved in colicin uptake
MPRATESPASKILTYFRTATMEAAEQLLDLCTSEVKARRSKSAQAKARAKAAPAAETTTTAAAPAAPAPARRKAAKATKAKARKTRATRTRVPQGPQDTPLPMTLATAHDDGDLDDLIDDEEAPQPALID